ncbi:phosphoribosyltransferase [Candidatus Bathyarchaeota archaeon]|nr:phosphoribosyltransferase [Candidatus Bathyarchaeota archaeon]
MKDKLKFEIPSWNQIHKMLINQKEKIRSDNFIPDTIIAITRGGWIPARLLSDLLEVHDLTTIRVEFYLGPSKTREKPILTQKLSKQIAAKKILLVDDVADSGKSLQIAKNHILQKHPTVVKIATLYKKPQSKIEPNYYEKIAKHWIIFPWDIRETSKKIWEQNQNKNSIKNKEMELIQTGLTKTLIKKFLKEITEENK